MKCDINGCYWCDINFDQWVIWMPNWGNTSMEYLPKQEVKKRLRRFVWYFAILGTWIGTESGSVCKQWRSHGSIFLLYQFCLRRLTIPRGCQPDDQTESIINLFSYFVKNHNSIILINNSAQYQRQSIYKYQQCRQWNQHNTVIVSFIPKCNIQT